MDCQSSSFDKSSRRAHDALAARVLPNARSSRRFAPGWLHRAPWWEHRCITATARAPPSRTLVAGGLIVLCAALWKLRLVLALLFFALISQAAMRPGSNGLAAHRLPRPAGLALQLPCISRRARTSAEPRVATALYQSTSRPEPERQGQIARHARNSTGSSHEVLVAVQSASKHPVPTMAQAREAGPQIA